MNNRKEELDRIEDERMFNYFFVENTPVLLDSIFYDRMPDHLKKFIDEVGIVLSCNRDIHAFGRGWHYLMTVQFGEVTVPNILPFFIREVAESDIDLEAIRDLETLRGFIVDAIDDEIIKELED